MPITVKFIFQILERIFLHLGHKLCAISGKRHPHKQNKKKLQSPKHALENLRSHLLKPIYIKQAIYCITTF